MTDTPAETFVQLPVLWVGLDDQPVTMANQFVGQIEGDQVVLSVGQLVPPVLLGSVDEQLEQVGNVSYVPVRTVARVSMTRSRLEELITVLRTTLENYDGSHAGGQPT